jgi:hypothetical protein
MTAVLVAIAAHVLVVGTQQVERTQPAIVFVCEHGAAQSLIATAYFNKLAAERGLPYRAPRATSLCAPGIKGCRPDRPPTLGHVSSIQASGRHVEL